MPRAEYQVWEEFHKIEPWGLEVQDSMFAQVVQVLANANRDSKKYPQIFPLQEFLLYRPRAEAARAESSILLVDKNAQTELLIAAQFGSLKIKRADRLP